VKTKTMQRMYLREAAIMLALACLAVRCLPPAQIFAWANRAPRRRRRFVIDEPTWIAWAVETRATRRRVPVLCLPRALAAHAMLRGRGIASRLCLGVARQGGALAAHAWIELGDAKLVGGSEAGSFTRLAAFGASA
jgi:hypothetical protein